MSVMDVDFDVQFTKNQMSSEEIGAQPHVHADFDSVGEDPVGRYKINLGGWFYEMSFLC